MKDYTYNFEISDLITQFADAFNEIVIKRYSRSGSQNNPTQKGNDINVKFLYAPKQRVVHDFNNNQAKLTLPIVCYSIAGISRDPNRVFNKIEGPDFNISERDSYLNAKQPVPVNLEISMTLMSRYQEDMDQLITNFSPYCDPYVVISWPNPYVPKEEIRTIVEWNGSVNINYPTDLTYNNNFIITADTTFSLKGWLFKKETDIQGGNIFNIDTSFFAVSDIYCDYSANVANQLDINTDTVYISGQPTITDVMPYVFDKREQPEITFRGTNFSHTTAYFLSGDLFEDTFYDFTSSRYTSAFFDYDATADGIGFYGLQIEPTIFTDNVAQFTMPSLTSTGFFDIIAVNDAGVGYLTQDSIIYPLTAEDFTPYQKPCVNGVQVISSY